MKNLTFFILLISLISAEAQQFDFVNFHQSSDMECDVDADGNVFVIGNFMDSIDLDPTSGDFWLYGAEFSKNFFVAQFSASGMPIWGKAITGDNECVISDIHAGEDGNLYLTGHFRGTVDFDPDTTVHEVSSTTRHGYILKLDKEGNFVWLENFRGGAGSSRGQVISMDKDGNIYVGGIYAGDTNFGRIELQSAIGSDAFLAKFRPDRSVAWAESIGWDGSATTENILFDQRGNVYVSGTFSGVLDYDEGTKITSTGGSDIFFGKHPIDGSKWEWMKSFGGTKNESAPKMEFVEAEREIFLSGSFNGDINYQSQSGTQTLETDFLNGFIMLFSTSNGSIRTAKAFETGGFANNFALTKTHHGKLLMLGSFSESLSYGSPNSSPGNLSTNFRTALFLAEPDIDGNLVKAVLLAEGPDIGIGDQKYDLEIDLSGNIYSTGPFEEIADFYSGGEQVSITVPDSVYHSGYFLKISDQFSSVFESMNPAIEPEIFPNPSSGILNFKNKKTCYDLEIFFPSGKKAGELKAQCNSVDLSFLPEGNYFINLKNDEKVEVINWLKY